MEQSLNSQKGSGDGEVWLFLIGLGIGLTVVVLIILWFFGFNFGQVSEGYVKTSDCRASIELKKGSWGTYFGKFVCSNGDCSKVVVKDGECETEYYYTAEE